MMRTLFWLVSSTLLFAGSARADNDADVLAQFGLVGSWAADCHAVPSPTNPFVNFTFSDTGQPMRLVIAGKPQYQSMVPLSEMVSVDETHLQFSYPQAGVTVTVILVKEQNRIRPYRAIASDGTVSVENGIVKSSGQETNWLLKCGG
jgi:hypothetical protein